MANKAEYQFSTSVNEEILEINITGELTKSSAKEMTNKFSDIVEVKKIEQVLVDVRALNGRLSITETYERVRNYPHHMYKFHIAFVDILENADYELFHETTAQNAGQRLKCFTDIDEARVWLKSKQKKK